MDWMLLRRDGHGALFRKDSIERPRRAQCRRKATRTRARTLATATSEASPMPRILSNSCHTGRGGVQNDAYRSFRLGSCSAQGTTPVARPRNDVQRRGCMNCVLGALHLASLAPFKQAFSAGRARAMRSRKKRQTRCKAGCPSSNLPLQARPLRTTRREGCLAQSAVQARPVTPS